MMQRNIAATRLSQGGGSIRGDVMPSAGISCQYGSTRPCPLDQGFTWGVEMDKSSYW